MELGLSVEEEQSVQSGPGPEDGSTGGEKREGAFK